MLTEVSAASMAVIAASAPPVEEMSSAAKPVAVAAAVARAPIEIQDVANVATSFPGFPEAARAIGLDLASS